MYTQVYNTQTSEKVNHKEKILKEDGVGGKHTYRGTRIRITLNFYSETIQGRREWSEIFKGWKEKNILFSTDDIRIRGATSWNQKTMTNDFVGGKKGL